MALYSALFFGLLVSIAASSINTHALGADQFGDFKFIQNLSMFSVTFLTMGFFVSAGRYFAITDNINDIRSMLGSVIAILFLIYIIFALLFLFISSYLVVIFNRDLGWLIQISLPLIFIYPLNVCLENILKGLNAIYSLALTRFLPNFIYLLYAYYLFKADELNLTSAYFGYLGISAFFYVAVLLNQKPMFNEFCHNIHTLIQTTREYGFKVYTGILASVATMQLGGVMTAYYLDTRSAGFFLLASTITMPLIQVSTTLGITLFKRFAKSQSISTKVILIMLGVSVGLLIFFFMVIEDLVKWLYPPEFEIIISLCYIMAIGATLQGLGGVLNNYLCAKGYGVFSRNASFIRGGVNLLGFTLGIKFFGLLGASITVLAAGACFLVAQLYYYKLATRKV